MRAFALRLLMLALATVPVAWGTCPTWLESDSVSPGVETKARACPCCAQRESPVDRDPSDRRQRDCEWCPVLDVRHTASPAPVAVSLPAGDLVFAPEAGLHAPAATLDVVPKDLVGDRSGGSPPLVGRSPVLLI